MENTDCVLDKFKYSYSGKNEIGDKGCRQLAQELSSEEMENLGLSYNKISEKGCELIGQISQWKKLKTLWMSTTLIIQMVTRSDRKERSICQI